MDPRLDFLEGRVEEQSRNWERMFADVGRVDQKIDALGERLSAEVGRLDQKIDALGERLSAEIGRLDQRIDANWEALLAEVGRVNLRIEALDLKLDRKIDGLRGDLATQFHWTIGIMTALFTGVLAAILTR